MVAAVRRGYAVACVRRGEVATADGCCVGIRPDTGRRAVVSWREALGGVLVTGIDGADVTCTCLDVVAAAILHRKSVLVIDMTSGTSSGQRRRCGAVTASVLSAVAAVSEEAAAPLMVFGSGSSCYEPFAEAGPADSAGLVIAMADWAGSSPARREFCGNYVSAALEVIAADGPAARSTGRPPRSVLDDLAALLVPGALPAQLGDMNGAAAALALRGRVAALASQLAADPAATASLAAQLARLRRSAAGEQLRPPRSGPATGIGAISLARALAERQVIVFPLDTHMHRPSGLMVARLVIADLARVLTERAGVPADCLVWVNGVEGIDQDLAAMARGGQRAGMATLLSTASGQAARALADRVNVVLVRGRPPPGMVAEGARASAGTWPLARGQTAPAGLSGLAGESLLTNQDSQVLPAELLAGARPDALALHVSWPAQRLVPGCRVVR